MTYFVKVAKTRYILAIFFKKILSKCEALNLYLHKFRDEKAFRKHHFLLI